MVSYAAEFKPEAGRTLPAVRNKVPALRSGAQTDRKSLSGPLEPLSGTGGSTTARSSAPVPAAVLAAAAAGQTFDTHNPADLTFSYGQRNPYSFAASDTSTRISIASQGKATIPFPAAKAKYVYRRGYTGGSVLYAVPPPKAANTNPNRVGATAFARLAQEAAYAQPPPDFKCAYARHRHSPTKGLTNPMPVTASADAAVAAGVPSVVPGQPRPVVAVHKVATASPHAIDRLHRGVSRNSAGGFYTS